jgi:TM2 domain-containing membrane protein YozV
MEAHPMRTGILLLCVTAFLFSSFSVQLAQTGAALQVSTAHAAATQAASKSQNTADSGKSRLLTAFLAFFCGLHQFYLENYVSGVIYIALTLLFGAGPILSLIDCILLVAMSDQQFHRDVIAGETYWGFLWFKRLLFDS